MSSNTTAYDESSGLQFTRPVQDGRTLEEYPFLQNGDLSAVIYRRSLLVRRAYYVPIAPGTQRDSVWEGGDPYAWNLPDTPLQPTGIGDLCRVVRSYARIPKTQTVPVESRVIVFPRPVNQFNGATSLTATDGEYNQTLAQGHYQGGTLWTSGDSKLYQGRTVSAAIAGRATGGTFTLTYGSSTTGALNWNDTGATIAAALNALASAVSDGITFGCTNNLSSAGSLTIAATLTTIPSGWPKKVTMTATGLTVTTSKNPVTLVNTGNSQTIYLPDHLTISSHGFDTSQRLAAANTNDVLLALPTAFWGSVDSNTIWLPSAGSFVWRIAGDYVREYVPGSKLARLRDVTSFYLPGVTAGITTTDDITVPIGLENPEDFLNALVTLTGWQDYQADGPSQWLSPIYKLRITQIDLDSI
jgi:hypothetical protein